MDVYFVPIGRDRFETYFEAADEEPDPVHAPGLFARWRARFSAMIRDIERERQEPRHATGSGVLASARRWVVRWIAERVAEQRLLWNLAGADAATLHVPDHLGKNAAEKLMRDAMRRDADRHLRLLLVHAVGLLLSVPFVVIPGPNIFGYFFTFTVLGHFMAWRGARRALNRIRWTVVSSPELSELQRALTLDAAARHQRICDVAERLRLHRLVNFVERMAAPTA
jgi:Mitochondrial K+-H+ exchange-related